MNCSSLTACFLVFGSFMAAFPFQTASSQNSTTPDISESSIELSWKVNSNFEPGNQMSATLTIINNGDDPLPDSGWTLYFNSIRIPDLDSFPETLTASHINGYLFKLEPGPDFKSISPGGQIEIPYRAAYFSIKESDAPEGFYFVFDDDSIETVESITIHPFETEEQLNRSPNDNVAVPTPQTTYEKNQRLIQLSNDELSPITPTPVSYEKADGQFSFGETIRIYAHPSLGKEAFYLSGILMKQHGFNIELTGTDEQADIRVQRSNTYSNSPESYRLEITPEQISLSAGTPAGAFYGIQSLHSLIASQQSDEITLSAARITDEPAFQYRGMHLDVARNFQSADDVKRLLDIMATYKLNTFHFHLTDDEGWRIAIKALPELTEVGGRRGHTESETEYMIPVYGSGPDPTPGSSFGSGWYSQEEYIDILRYAADRHIEVIPEIDMPGHARAAILAMKARAGRFIEKGDMFGAGKFQLDDPEDESSYRSVQNYTDNVVNVCQESTYRFMNLVIDELIEMHKDAGTPLTMMHIGGDEVPHGAWEKSPACAEKMDQLGLESARDLQGYFFGRIAEKLSEHNITMGGWEEVALTEDGEGFSGVNTDFTETTVPYSWNNVWGSGTEDRAYKLANAGYKVVMSHASNFYFDLAYNKHWQEPGFYWAAMLTTEEPFSFMPYNLFESSAETNYGNQLPDDYFDGKVRLNPDARENILGLQGQLWTETVNEPGRMDYMIYPRLLGLAERAWGGEPAWSDETDLSNWKEQRLNAWNEFANRLATVELPKLDQFYPGLNYRIPAPGAIIRDDTLHANISLPGLILRYELDGSEPTAESPEYTAPVQLTSGQQPRVAAFNTTGRSGRSVQPER